MDRFAAILAFTKVAENGSFTRAADRLGVSVSTVTKNVALLESHLNVRLFNRSTRRVALTDEGREFFQHCGRILGALEEAELAMDQSTAVTSGRLHVQVPVAAARLYIIPALPRFLADHPGLTVEITQTDKKLDLIKYGIDVSIWAGHIPDSTLTTRLLARSHRVTCASPAYLERFGRPTTPDDLVHHNCLRTTSWQRGHSWLFRGAEGKEVLLPISGNLLVNSGDSYREAALAGLGIAQATSLLFVGDIRSGALEPILTDYTAPGQDYWIVYPPGRMRTPKVRAFTRFVHELFRGLQTQAYPPSAGTAAGIAFEAD